LSEGGKIVKEVLDSSATPRRGEAGPVEEHWANVQGGRMRYLRAGAGPTLILLHGLLGYSFSWRLVIPALAKHSTIYAPDMLGAGFSEHPADLECSFAACARRLLSFAQEVGISSFDLLGTSHGGAVAMMAAARANKERERRVRSLILVAPVNPWSAHGRRLAPLLSSGLGSLLFPVVARRAVFTHSWVLRRLYGDPGKISPGTLEGYSRPLEAPGRLAYPVQVLSSWGRDLRELETNLSGLENLPTLIMWGDRDRAVDPASARELQTHFRNSRTVTFSGVGHLPYEEAPEQFSLAVTEFLECVRGSESSPART
jgi:pimeloyl-ACP methyl ester carboxylesterase